jgi:hypothetical protein
MLFTPESAPAYGESKNIPVVETYSTFTVNNDTLVSSGYFTHQSTILAVSEQNTLLPALIKKVHHNGTEIICRYTYVKRQ